MTRTPIALALCCFLSAALLALPGCQGGGPANDAAKEKVERPQAVRTVKVRRGPVRDAIRYVGTLSAEREVQVVAQNPGTIATLSVKEGDRFRARDLLLRISTPELPVKAERVQAEASRARVEAAHACKTLATDERLAQGGHIPKERLDMSRKACDAASAASAASAAAGREATVASARSFERAPFDGVVLQRFVEPGQVVGPGRPLLLLGSEGREVKLRASEADFARGLKVGARALISVGGRAALERPVTRVAPAASQHTRSVEVGIALQPDDALDVPVGTSVDVTVVLAEVPDATAVPVAALLRDGDTARVFIVEGERVRAANVQPGLEELGWVAIEPALPEGTRVIARGVSAIDPARPVWAVEDEVSR